MHINFTIKHLISPRKLLIFSSNPVLLWNLVDFNYIFFLSNYFHWLRAENYFKHLYADCSTIHYLFSILIIQYLESKGLHWNVYCLINTFRFFFLKLPFIERIWTVESRCLNKENSINALTKTNRFGPHTSFYFFAFCLLNFSVFSFYFRKKNMPLPLPYSLVDIIWVPLLISLFLWPYRNVFLLLF